MKVELKFKEKVGSRSGWKKVRCSHCNQVAIFPSLRKAREYAEEHGYTETQIDRID